MDTTCLLGFDHDFRLFFVQANATVLHFARQLQLLLFAFLRVKHHEHQVGRFADGDDLATATLAIRGTVDDTWQVKELELGSVDVKLSWDAGERSELVSRGLRLLLGHRRQE